MPLAKNPNSVRAQREARRENAKEKLRILLAKAEHKTIYFVARQISQQRQTIYGQFYIIVRGEPYVITEFIGELTSSRMTETPKHAYGRTIKVAALEDETPDPKVYIKLVEDAYELATDYEHTLREHGFTVVPLL